MRNAAHAVRGREREWECAALGWSSSQNASVECDAVGQCPGRLGNRGRRRSTRGYGKRSERAFRERGRVAAGERGCDTDIEGCRPRDRVQYAVTGGHGKRVWTEHARSECSWIGNRDAINRAIARRGCDEWRGWIRHAREAYRNAGSRRIKATGRWRSKCRRRCRRRILHHDEVREALAARPCSWIEPRLHERLDDVGPIIAADWCLQYAGSGNREVRVEVVEHIVV